MYAKLYNYNETNFNSLGLGVLKDALTGKVTHERNGQYDLELEYPVSSRLAKHLKKNNIIKADAGKRFKGQLFRIFKVNKTLENTIKVYANHITYDLQDNFIPKIDLSNSSCMNALNSIKTNAAFEVPFTFSTDITHSANFKIERVDALSALGGTEGSIIDTFGNGANIIRDNFNISIMQNYGQDNNVLIAYKKNMKSLDVEDEGDIVTGIYPFATLQEGINSETETVSSIIELPNKILFREDYKDFEKQKVIEVDFSNNGSINSVEKLEEAAKKYFKNYTAENLSIKVDFLDETSLTDLSNISQLKTLDVYDYVIIRHLGLDLNYKSKINKAVYNFILEEYESLEIGDKRTNLSTDTVSMEQSFKTEIDKTNNFWQQAVEHATSQITGNSGGYVKMYPPDKPSEIFIMDQDNANLATNVLRMNKEGIGFSKNGINGPFETAWTSDGTFYANWITAGVLSAIMLQNIDGSLQIDLGSSNGIMTKRNGKNAIELAGTTIKFHEWDGEGENIGQIHSTRLNGIDGKPGLVVANKSNAFLSLGYEKDDNFHSYMDFDRDKVNPNTKTPITIFNETEFRGSQMWFGYDINSIYNSTGDSLVNKVKNSFIVADKDTSLSRLVLGKKELNLYDVTNDLDRYAYISPSETFFGSNGSKYFNCSHGAFSFWDNKDGMLYTTTSNSICSNRDFHVNKNFTVSGTKNCIQSTEHYGDRLYYSVEDCESYLTDRSMELFTVEKTNEGTFERIILLDNIYKESVNLDIGYTVEVIKQGWGDYRIKEQAKDYFIVEADREDFTFKYVVTAKRLGFEEDRNKEFYINSKEESINFDMDYLNLNNDNEVNREAE